MIQLPERITSTEVLGKYATEGAKAAAVTRKAERAKAAAENAAAENAAARFDSGAGAPRPPAVPRRLGT